MTPDDFKKRQKALKWSSKRVAGFMRRSEQTVSNWRTGRQAIPDYVGQLFAAAEQAVALKKAGVIHSVSSPVAPVTR